ncbi:hypothetical protein SFRURICE_010778 [Spodoptera frugiperda]|nr:hypothetical protein SFRURICE_010778 [Spodoptera frugiperda]
MSLGLQCSSVFIVVSTVDPSLQVAAIWEIVAGLSHKKKQINVKSCKNKCLKYIDLKYRATSLLVTFYT